MKRNIPLAVLFLALCVCVSACSTLLEKKPAPTAMVVTLGGASTNDPNLVAYLKAATVANKTVDVTPYQGPIDVLLVGLTALASAGAGWYVKHKSATAAATQTAAATALTTAATAAATTQALAAASVKPTAPSVVPMTNAALISALNAALKSGGGGAIL